MIAWLVTVIISGEIITMFLFSNITRTKNYQIVVANLTYTAQPPIALAIPWNSAVSCLLYNNNKKRNTRSWVVPCDKREEVFYVIRGRR